MEDVDGNTYYIVLDFQNDTLQNFHLQKINFGIKEKIGPTHYYNKVSFASLTPGYNVTNFQHMTLTGGSVADGIFSGKLRSLHDGDITIDKGTFHLDFKTARD